MAGEEKRATEWPRDLPYLAAVLFVFLAVVVAVNPLRGILHEDDFSWAHQVKQLVEGGGFALGGWGLTTEVFTTLWGTLFCLPLGFSFPALIVSTVVLVFVGIVALYYLLGEYVPSRAACALGALGILGNPVSLNFAFSFMTEMPYASLMTLSLACLVRYIDTGFRRRGLLAAGCAAGALTFLVRQTGIVLALAILAVLAWRSWRTRKLLATEMAIAGAFPVAAAALWLGVVAADPNSATAASLRMLVSRRIEIPSFYGPLSLNAAGRIFFLTIYPVFFLLPLAVAGLASAGRRLPLALRPFLDRRAVAAAAATGFVLAALFVLSDKKGPSLSEGLSPRDVDPRVYFESTSVWSLGILASSVLVSFVTGLAFGHAKPSPSAFFLGLCVLFSYGFIVRVPFWFVTTYAVPLSVVPLAAFVLAALGGIDPPKRAAWFLAPVVLAALVFSASLARARLELQEGVWREGSCLIDQGVPTERIAAGSLAWMGWHHYAAARERLGPIASLDPTMWMPRAQPTRLVLTRPLDAFAGRDFEEESRRVVRHMGWPDETIHVYRRRER